MVPEKFIAGELQAVDLILSDKSIYESLVSVKDNRVLISVRQGQQRAIGKTTALIKFAKENGYTVLVGNNAIAKMLAKHFKYNNIRSINSVLDGLGGVVVDECCPCDLVQKLVNRGHLLVTGFVKQDL